MSTPKVTVTKQIRRIDGRRRKHALLTIASMGLQQQWNLALDLWELERALKAHRPIDTARVQRVRALYQIGACVNA